MSIKYFISVILMICSVTVFANDNITVTGEYTFYGEKHHSRITCENYALEHARISAIEKTFGISVSQDIFQHDTENSTTYSALNNTEIQGEWVSDIEPPKYTYILSNEGCYIVTCYVKGIIRRISNSNNIEIESYMLKNGTDLSHASNRFKANDKLFVYFKSPIDGYVAIFIIGDKQQVYRVLPYSTGDICEIKVKHDKPYIFFSDKCKDPTHGTVDELTFILQETDISIEYNCMYIIFSTNPFNKPVDNKQEENVPPVLSYENFNKWVKSNMLRDKNMSIKKIHFSISSK